MSDPEIKAMDDVAAALGALEEDARLRVIRWVADRNGIPLSSKDVQPTYNSQTSDNSPSADSESNGNQSSGFTEFSDLYDAVNPQSNANRALVGAYWFQVLQREPVVRAQQINTELKNLGYPLTNVTDALADSQRTDPKLITQTSKSGKSKQARKTYKLTKAGIQAVEDMIANGA